VSRGGGGKEIRVPFWGSLRQKKKCANVGEKENGPLKGEKEKGPASNQKKGRGKYPMKNASKLVKGTIPVKGV